MDSSKENSEKSFLPVVSVDGEKIKYIREAKKLTQLYVATVVGVTTDTISRWENNRYPTIKRENAEKLASALESELGDILQEGKEVTSADFYSPSALKRLSFRSVVSLTTGGILVIVLVVLFFSHRQAAVPVAERKLPGFGAPGEVIPVQIRIISNDPAISGLIIKERLPVGWRLVNSMPAAASVQPDMTEIKWLIPSGSGPATIYYTVRISPVASLKTSANFGGEVVIMTGDITRRGTCGGDGTITVDGVHWADRNRDGRIDDDEIMPAYYLTEEMKGMGLDWKAIEAIWSGKGYRWISKTMKFEVVK